MKTDTYINVTFFYGACLVSLLYISSLLLLCVSVVSTFIGSPIDLPCLYSCCHLALSSVQISRSCDDSTERIVTIQGNQEAQWAVSRRMRPGEWLTGVHVSVCLSVCMSVCLSVCMYVIHEDADMRVCGVGDATRGFLFQQVHLRQLRACQ